MNRKIDQKISKKLFMLANQKQREHTK